MSKFNSIHDSIIDGMSIDARDFAADYAGSCTDLANLYHEYADNNIPIYYSELDSFAADYPELMSAAIIDGLALSGLDYFSSYPGTNYLDYTRHVASVASYMGTLDNLCADQDKIIALIVWYEVRNNQSISDDMRCQVYGHVINNYGIDERDSPEEIARYVQSAADYYLN